VPGGTGSAAAASGLWHRTENRRTYKESLGRREDDEVIPGGGKAAGIFCGFPLSLWGKKKAACGTSICPFGLLKQHFS